MVSGASRTKQGRARRISFSFFSLRTGFGTFTAILSTPTQSSLLLAQQQTELNWTRYSVDYGQEATEGQLIGKREFFILWTQDSWAQGFPAFLPLRTLSVTFFQSCARFEYEIKPHFVWIVAFFPFKKLKSSVTASPSFYPAWAYQHCLTAC